MRLPFLLRQSIMVQVGNQSGPEALLFRWVGRAYIVCICDVIIVYEDGRAAVARSRGLGPVFVTTPLG